METIRKFKETLKPELHLPVNCNRVWDGLQKVQQFPVSQRGVGDPPANERVVIFLEGLKEHKKVEAWREHKMVEGNAFMAQ